MKIYGCILAAGLGSRLGKYTEANSKWLIEVNGTSLAYRYLKAFYKNNINNILIVTGHASQDLIQSVNSINKEFNLNLIYVHNQFYSTTNNIYSLDLALKEVVNRDFDRLIIAECDLFISEEATNGFLKSTKGNYLLASPYQYWMDGSCISCENEGAVKRLLNKNEIPYDNYSGLFKTVNWYSFDREYIKNKLQPFVNIYNSRISNISYYELVIKILLEISDIPLKLHLIDSSQWYEIDDISDLSNAECLDDILAGKFDSLVTRYGGFWKFPWLTDLTLLVNPYFPTNKMKKEISFLIERTIGEYPSSQKCISKLASKTLSVSDQEIIVGNGVCELMMNILPNIKGKFEIAVPFFLEYESILGNALINLKETEDFSALNHLIIVNPNNPDGKVISFKRIIEIAQKLEKNNKFLIYDESFADFYRDEEISLMHTKILDKYKNIIVLKSFGKTYGIAGLRLGILASGNKKIISKFKKYIPIWNINTPAEIFLDLLPRYKNEYDNSILKISEIAQEFFHKFEKINNKKIYVYKPTANFLLIKFHNEMEIHHATEDLFKNGFIVKTIIGRQGLPKYCMRIAVLNPESNDKVASIITNSLI